MEHTNPFSHRFDWLAFVDSAEGQRTPVLLLEAEYNRARACWNACDGMNTETLENIVLLGDTFSTRFADRNKAAAEAEREVAALKAQRDELLAGLERMCELYPPTTVARPSRQAQQQGGQPWLM